MRERRFVSRRREVVQLIFDVRRNDNGSCGHPESSELSQAAMPYVKKESRKDAMFWSSIFGTSRLCVRIGSVRTASMFDDVRI